MARKLSPEEMIQPQEEIMGPPASLAPIPGKTGGEGTGAAIKGLARAVGNVPASAGKLAGDIYQAVRHPLETADDALKLGIGVGQKLYPGEQEGEKYADAAMEYLKGRYGSRDAMAETFQTDPVGFLADFAGVLTAGGGALNVAGKVAKAPGIAKAGQLAAKAGLASEPVGLAVKGIGKGLGQAVPKTGRLSPAGAYESAAKFSTVFSENERLSMTMTALNNQVLPTIRGLNTLQKRITDINTKITRKIDAATTTGKKMSIDDIFKDFKKISKEESWGGKPKEGMAAVAETEKNLREIWNELGRTEMTPAQAQAFKQKIYQEVEGFYSKVNDSPVSVKAQAAMARAAKEFLEEIYPEIKQMNANEGEMIELLNALERSSSRIANRDFIGIGVPIKGITGGTMGGVPGGMAGIIIGIADAPLPKAQLALIGHKLQQQGITLSPGLKAIVMGAEAIREREKEQP